MTPDLDDTSRVRFERSTERFHGDPDVTQGTGFGSHPGLRVRDKIFAMLARDALVVKLPQARVDELVAAGVAVRFDAGKGRPMREWASIAPDAEADWGQLAIEARAFADQRRQGG
jgi:TfoX/Sxy family transcriptional regulator of competence genes